MSPELVPYHPRDEFERRPRSSSQDALTQRLNALQRSPLPEIPDPEVREFDNPDNVELVSVDSALPFKYRMLLTDFSEFNPTQSTILETVLKHENSIVITSPTSTGKTVAFELAIIKELLDSDSRSIKFNKKIIYLSPQKAICDEKFKNWMTRFSDFMKVAVLTGDSQADDGIKMRKSNLIVATPEKWDAITRKWTSDNKSVMDQTVLVCIDEIHGLDEESRGPSIEALVSRIKTSKLLKGGRCRFVAASATTPNVEDIGKWLGDPHLRAICFKFKEKYRPYSLKYVVKGYDYRVTSDFAFSNALNRNVAEIVNQFAPDDKGTLLFSMTRGTVESAATSFYEKRLTHPESDLDRYSKLRILESKIETPKLRKIIIKGVAYHHAGLPANDRKEVEEAFRQGLINFIATTSTLSMGVNLPVHLVIIKGTHKWMNGAVEFTSNELLQMAGRAGREGEGGVCVVMCRSGYEQKYYAILRGEKVIESHLHKNLGEHLNAEIALSTIKDASHALRWLKSTYFYVRCLKNKSRYGLNDCDTQEKVENRLRNLLIAELNRLCSIGLIRMENDGTSIVTTYAGDHMAYFHLDINTMKRFSELGRNCSVQDLLRIICSTTDMTRDVTLRHDEKCDLFAIGCAKNSYIRWPLPEKLTKSEDKAFALAQADFSCLDGVPQLKRFSLDLMRVRSNGRRLSSCLRNYVTREGFRDEMGFKTVRNTCILYKMFQQGLWWDSPHQLKQLPDVGTKLANIFKDHGITSIDQLLTLSPDRIEGIVSRRQPFGANLLRCARGVPDYCAIIQQNEYLEDNPSDPLVRRCSVHVALKNWQEIRERLNGQQSDRRVLPAGTHHQIYVIVANSRDEIIFFTTAEDEKFVKGQNGKVSFDFEVKKTTSRHDVMEEYLYLSLISTSWVGNDMLGGQKWICWFGTSKQYDEYLEQRGLKGTDKLSQRSSAPCASSSLLTPPVPSACPSIRPQIPSGLPSLPSPIVPSPPPPFIPPSGRGDQNTQPPSVKRLKVSAKKAGIRKSNDKKKFY